MPGHVRLPHWNRSLNVWCLSFGLIQAASTEPRRVADLDTTHASAWFSKSLRIELRSATPRSTIYFTTNGAVPTPQLGQGKAYIEPLVFNTTTVLRAAAFRDGWASSKASTWIYLRAEDLLIQTGTGWPTHWGTHDGKPVPADYAMDPLITGDPALRPGLATGLQSLPTLSLVLDPKDLFDPLRGVYAHPLETGENWERPAAVEFLLGASDTSQLSGFALDAGLRIQGGWNRRPEESPKHSLRLTFRKRYGAAPLRYPVFPGTPSEFETLILRGGNNNSWLHWSSVERQRADYLRDEWLRQTYAALGHVSARGRFVHLTLNGLYWGIYNLVERPDHHFAAAHFGGRPTGYDARNADKILSGDSLAWDKLLALVEAGVSTDRDWAAIGAQLDLPAFIDYLLVNLYGGNADWDGASNWYAARPRSAGGQFVFFVWDGERTLEQVADNRLADDAPASPLRLFQKLRQSPEFRRQFALRAQAVCSGTGPLSPAAAAARYRQLVHEIEPAIALESARWGDHRLVVAPYKTGPFQRYTREGHWRPEVTRLLETYFPQRTDVFIGQLRAAELYPSGHPN